MKSKYKDVYIKIEMKEDNLNLFRTIFDFLHMMSRKYEVGFKFITYHIKEF